jgi:hypothetical protein
VGDLATNFLTEAFGLAGEFVARADVPIASSPLARCLTSSGMSSVMVLGAFVPNEVAISSADMVATWAMVVWLVMVRILY